MWTCGAPCWSAGDKPVNFIFLVDVSGSMVSKSTMVTDDKGGTTTLFEALRLAVKNIVADERLIKSGSRIAFITFGTEVSEKTDWPTSTSSPEERAKLVQLIADPATLSADRKGDTYMGGALNQALAKADEFLLKSDPCTTTFILMLTDGWDEPPANAQFKVSDVATKIVQKKNTIKNKVGIDTWQTAVIGLKRLPTSKSGTTTAAELSTMINGTFLDITKEKGKSVSDQIYVALSKILENQRGTITFAGNGNASASPVIDFGTVNGEGVANGSFEVEMLACDQEQVTEIKESSKDAPKEYWAPLFAQAETLHKTTKVSSVAELPAGAVKVIPEQLPLTISPQIDSEGRRSSVRKAIKLKCQAGAACPVGTFVGRLKLASTARIPESIPFMFSAPARLATRDDAVKVSFKRKGNLTKEDTETTLAFSFVQSEGSPLGAVYEITATVPSAKNNKSDTLESSCFNNGKPVTLTFDTNKQKSAEAVINVVVPSSKSPGTYLGAIKFDIKGPSEMSGPTELPFEIVMAPTDWERISPLAIPMILLLVIGIGVYIFLFVVSKTRK